MNNRIVNRDRGKISIIGRIKIGIKNEQKGYPMSLDYFRATGKFAENFKQQYGDKPNKLLIFFPNEKALSQQFTLYVDGKRFGLSDGETVEYIEAGAVKTKQFDTFEETELFMNDFAAKINRKQKSKPEWKLTVSLKFLLAELRNIMGLWQFETAGKASMVNQLANAFDNGIQMFNTIIGVPFWLSVEKVEHLSAKKNQKQIFPVVSLSPAIGFGQLIQLKTGANDVPELIDNTIKMLSPVKAVQKELPEIKNSLPEPKKLSKETIASIHNQIENGKGSVNEAISYYKNKGYSFNEDVFKKPRAQYLNSIIDSIENIGDLDDVFKDLKGKGYVITAEFEGRLRGKFVY